MTFKCTYNLQVESNAAFELIIDHRKYGKKTFTGIGNTLVEFDSFTNRDIHRLIITANTQVRIVGISARLNEEQMYINILKQKINDMDLFSERTQFLDSNQNIFKNSPNYQKRIDMIRTFVPMEITSDSKAIISLVVYRVFNK